MPPTDGQNNLLTSSAPAPAADMAGAYVATERLYLDKDGHVVTEDDPTRVELLLGVGGRMPRARALEYGLIQPAPTFEAAADKAAADKAAADKAAADKAADSGSTTAGA